MGEETWSLIEGYDGDLVWWSLGGVGGGGHSIYEEVWQKVWQDKDDEKPRTTKNKEMFLNLESLEIICISRENLLYLEIYCNRLS